MVWLRCHRTLRFLGKADLCDRRWADDEPCEPAEVLRDCSQCELELSASWPAQAQTTEPKDALEMCKQHLNTFAIAEDRSNASVFPSARATSRASS
jgi:hypothetical protein